MMRPVTPTLPHPARRKKLRRVIDCRVAPLAWSLAGILRLLQRSLFPPHYRNCREAVEGGTLDNPRAIRQIHQRPVRQINHAHDPRRFEDERGPLAKHLGLLGELRQIDGDWADLPTRDGKARPILRHPHCPFHPTGARLGEMAGYSRHLRVVKGTHTNLIVRAEDAERRGDTADVLRAQTPDDTAKQHNEDKHNSSQPSHPFPPSHPRAEPAIAYATLTPRWLQRGDAWPRGTRQQAVARESTAAIFSWRYAGRSVPTMV